MIKQDTKFLIKNTNVQKKFLKEIPKNYQIGEFLNNHIGYEKGEDGKFPKGSIKRYQNDTIQFLVDDEGKRGMFNISNKQTTNEIIIRG